MSFAIAFAARSREATEYQWIAIQFDENLALNTHTFRLCGYNDTGFLCSFIIIHA